MNTKLSFAMYRPQAGKADELKTLVKEHMPTLREYGLVSDKPGYLAESSDGTIIEIFEWASDAKKNLAHEHPAIAAIWEKMGAICEFPAMKDLPEAQKPFPGFTTIHFE